MGEEGGADVVGGDEDDDEESNPSFDLRYFCNE